MLLSAVKRVLMHKKLPKTNTYLSKESTAVPEMKLLCDTLKKLLTVFQLT